MPAAFIPSPARSLWHLGPVPVRADALCFLLGIIGCLWLTERRYRRIGGRSGQILDIATLAVPFALIGGRAYSVLTSYHLFFGHHRDWADVLRIWDGPLALPGAVAGAALGAWIACRRTGVRLGPVAGAAAPGLAFAAAIACWGSWFTQQMYGRPAAVPWAVEIAPEHRVPGYEGFATFQPTFLYESVWDVLAGVLVILAARRFLLTGGQTFAVLAGLLATGMLCTGTLRIGYTQRLFGLPVGQVLMIVVLAGALGYLYLTRSSEGPDVLAPASPGILAGGPAADGEVAGGAAAGGAVAGGGGAGGAAAASAEATSNGESAGNGGAASPSFR